MEVFNFIKKLFLKHFAKKIIKLLPDLKKIEIEVIEEHTEELLDYLEIAVIKFIEKYENKQK